MLYGILVLICSSDVCQKYCLAGIETLAKSPAYRMDTREMTTTKAANTKASQKVQSLCTIEISKTVPKQEEII